MGGHRAFRPSVLARQLAKYGVINLGAAGTFVVTKPISPAKLRVEILRRLPFEANMMICSAKEIIRLASGDAFAGQPSGPDVVRFVSVLAKRPRVPPALPLSLPTEDDWLVRLIEVRGRFALGLYRRTMRTIGCLSQLDKRLGGSATTRNWNTIKSVVETLKGSARRVFLCVG